ncbi:uncharacterized protein LOC141647092 [Silene latifolia]|uniref:uncharacterized protein LOC141647092 n=1 Tax=Silene latifolia TaxID=37657 RepID=UPI003D76AEE7
MGLLFRSLMAVLLLVVSPWLPCFGQEESHSGDAPALDVLLQDYAYRAFVHPKTGVVFDGTVPSNLTGVKVSGMRLRNGSLFKRGALYKEFKIPKGVVVQPYKERLVLVYQNLGSLSSVYYPLPGYTYLAPILGLLAYDAINLSATNLPELDITASESPITIHFTNVKPAPIGSAPKCVLINLQGVVNFSNVVSENTCSTFQEGHFALVAEVVASPPMPEAHGPSAVSHKKKKKNMKSMWIILGSVVGGVLLLILMGMLLAWMRKYQKRKKMAHMEKASEVGEALRMTTVGSGKAPAAMVTRTQPTLETEYAP